MRLYTAKCDASLTLEQLRNEEQDLLSELQELKKEMDILHQKTNISTHEVSG